MRRRHRGGRGLKSVATGETLCDLEQAGRPGVAALPGAGHLDRHRAQDQGRPGEARPVSGAPHPRGPLLPGHDRRRDRPDDDLGHGRAAPGDHRGPAAARVQGASQRRPTRRLAYKETVTAKVTVSRAATSSRPGGSGDFGVVKIEVEPGGAGLGLQLRERRQGRGDPHASSSPRCEHGCEEASQSGAVWPATRWWTCRVTPRRRQAHDVDSSERSFKIAGSLAMKDALSGGEAGPARAGDGVSRP